MFKKFYCLLLTYVFICVTTGPIKAEQIWGEAEGASSISAPLQIVDDATASGGQYITVAAGNNSAANPPSTGVATYTVRIKEGGTYTMYLRVLTSPDVDAESSDSCWVHIQGATLNIAVAADDWINDNNIDYEVADPQDWFWKQVGHYAAYPGNDYVEFTMDPGTYTLEIAYREDGLWIDGFLITNEAGVDTATLPDMIPYVPYVPENISYNPSPADGASDIVRDISLGWTPGQYAATHDVYIGTNYDDVNDASRAAPGDVLVSQDQVATMYTPPTRFEFGQTYYWRIDDINATDGTITMGTVWSFTIEPVSYPLDGSLITATASSVNGATNGPEKTIDGSGLDGNDGHSTLASDMWLNAPAGDAAPWIQYDFDQIYKLDRLLVWNSNQSGELNIGWGVKDVKIETSVDGTAWTVVEGITQLTQAPGVAGAGPTDNIALGGIPAKYVRISITDNYSAFVAQTGLSEVRFLYKPVRARYPEPDINETDVSLDSVLSWRAGREAATHEVYFSAIEQAVTEGTIVPESVPAGACEASYAPPSLELSQTYYWKVNEVNSAESPALWKGDTWSFSTIEYSVVDDFEDYNDTEPDRIFDAWVDGWQIAENGSQVGYGSAPFAEQDTVHGGSQSMPFGYNNTGSATYSEASRTFIAPQDWTAEGAQMLTFFFWGDPQAFVELSAGNILMSGMGADIYDTTDEFRYAYKLLTGDGSITAKIESIQYTDDWAKAGVMIRSGLAALDLQVHMIGAPSGRIEWMYRSSAGAATTEVDTGEGSIELPHWVKLTRQGNTFTGYRSTDGVNWVSLTEGDPTSSSVNILLPSPAYIGLVVTSHVSGLPCAAEFSEVSTTGNVTGDWQLADIGVTQNTGNEPEQLYVAVEDSSGTSKAYEHPDNPNAVLLGGWQRWDIPLSVFSDTGVDLTSVNKLSIGVGDQAAPMSGTGMLFVDDIWLYSPLPTEPDPNATL